VLYTAGCPGSVYACWRVLSEWRIERVTGLLHKQAAITFRLVSCVGAWSGTVALLLPLSSMRRPPDTCLG
jgi:hypothetical protein